MGVSWPEGGGALIVCQGLSIVLDTEYLKKSSGKSRVTGAADCAGYTSHNFRCELR